MTKDVGAQLRQETAPRARVDPAAAQSTRAEDEGEQGKGTAAQATRRPRGTPDTAFLCVCSRPHKGNRGVRAAPISTGTEQRTAPFFPFFFVLLLHSPRARAPAPAHRCRKGRAAARPGTRSSRGLRSKRRGGRGGGGGGATLAQQAGALRERSDHGHAHVHTDIVRGYRYGEGVAGGREAPLLVLYFTPISLVSSGRKSPVLFDTHFCNLYLGESGDGVSSHLIL